MGAVDVDELVDPVRVEVAHLRDQARPADRGAHELLVRLAPEHGHGRVAHRGHDDRPGVDQRAVEVEEDDAVLHVSIVSTRGERLQPRSTCPADTPRARGRAPTAARSLLPRSAAGPRGAVRAAPGRLQHRADERSHHVAEERVGGDGEVEVVAVALPGRLADDADEHVVLALGGRERAEVVLTGQERGTRLERLEVDRPRPPERPLRLERRPRDAVQDEIAVRARGGREAGVEPVGRVLGVEHGHVGRKRRVERLGRPVGGRASRDDDARDLPRRVHARVGAAGDRETFPAVGIDDVEGLAQDALDGALAGLPRPAVEVAAVVLECELQDRHGPWFYHALTQRGAGSTSSTSPSTAATTTVAPGSIGSVERAFQISPSTRTWPTSSRARRDRGARGRSPCDRRSSPRRPSPDGAADGAVTTRRTLPSRRCRRSPRRSRARCSTARTGTGARSRAR